MESLNLNTLASSLPTANLQNAEKDLLNNFKAAALSITTLYRSSRHTSKRAYNAGYAAACQDLLMMIQQGVSVGDIGLSGTHDMEGGGMTIGKVMDWIEARVEAIKSREEEEEEDEEKEKEREAGRTANSAAPKPQEASKTNVPSTSASAASKRKEQAAPSLSITNAQSSSQPPSPSPPPPNSVRQIHQPQTRSSKSRSNPSISHRMAAVATMPNLTTPPNSNVTPTPTPSTPASTPHLAIATSFPPTPMADITITAGAKRRHAVMMMFDPSSTPVSVAPSDGTSHVPHSHVMSNGAGGGGPGGGGTRRRTKSARTVGGFQNQNLGEAMDVEEDSGRERKRVTRR